jgi:hypothetical protein
MILVLFVLVAWYIGFREGNIDGRFNLMSSIRDNISLDYCELSGCYLSFPEESIWVSCPSGFGCELKPLTKEEKERQATEQSLFQELLKQLPPPVEE